MRKVSIDELGSIFTQVLIEVVSIVSGFSLDVLSTERDPYLDGTFALMRLNGARGGMLIISAEDDGIRTLCSYMEGVPGDEITKEDEEDILGELVNMTAGNAKMRLNDTEYMFSISTPLIINGSNISITTKKRVNVISRVLGNGEISLKMKIIY